MEKKEINYNFQGEGLTDVEKKWGKKRFNDYRQAYPHTNTLSNLYLLEELVWKEVLQERLKKQFGDFGKKEENQSSDKITNPPKWLQDSLSEVLAQIVELKNKLGMFEEQKVSDEFKKIQELEEKAAQYRREHPLSFKSTCPHCSKIFYLKRRTENFEEFISPFYADDKVIKNDELHVDYKQGLFSKERYSKYLGVSVFYIDWLDEHIYKNVIKPTDQGKT